MPIVESDQVVIDGKRYTKGWRGDLHPPFCHNCGKPVHLVIVERSNRYRDEQTGKLVRPEFKAIGKCDALTKGVLAALGFVDTRCFGYVDRHHLGNGAATSRITPVDWPVGAEVGK